MMPVIDAFNKGDYIEVTPLEKDRGTHKDWGVLRGTALDGLGKGGMAIFNLQVPTLRTFENPALELRFNANDVDVRLLFSAKIARST
jgi:hypothetical protein